VLEVGQARQRGGLVDDRIGTHGVDHFGHRAGVEQVENNWLRAQGAQASSALRRTRGAEDFVALLDEPWHEPRPDRACRSYN